MRKSWLESRGLPTSALLDAVFPKFFDDPLPVVYVVCAQACLARFKKLDRIYEWH